MSSGCALLGGFDWSTREWSAESAESAEFNWAEETERDYGALGIDYFVRLDSPLAAG